MQTDIYKTSDLYEAAALLSSGIKLIRLELTTKTHVIFLFENNSECQRLASDYLNGNLMINCRNFMSSWKFLRRKVDDKQNKY
jgi:hypothetical protein